MGTKLNPMIKRLWLMAGLTLAAGPQAARAEAAYLDDRSSPEVLVRSLYNAINRKEYARAYAYFGTPPAQSLDDYKKGYEKTQRVEVTTGAVTADGAAGSIFYGIPVAIRAYGTDGSEQVFKGCYTLRFIQPSVQTTPYQPLQIESGRLEAGELNEPLEMQLPANCGNGEALPALPLEERAKRLFDTVYEDECPDRMMETADEPQSHAIRFNYAYDGPEEEPREAHLFRFFCSRGAYNERHAYVLANDFGELSPLQFAVPDLDIRYENDDPDAAVEEILIVGYKTEGLLVNSSFDPQELTISSRAMWRGLGDASSNGVWMFRSGSFSLVRYEVDASYDGKINPETVLDYLTGP
ncbi:DUF1176 domain-containing protein [Chelativorans sp. Marseille-P2723]|uniref:DUF1176 domain-containing protein n=1 Tax=Chelativorans sp. Marseille-P2723 TaxID=2709133 RepID=UPI001FEFE8E7|nr:DUF1176 domain-containing protein [Chelativorans sp. Marseille-P2723]